ncbi:hypothetical protein SAMN04488556_1452 [Halostagnicola kamekurae]|uniref:Uncharacterized protein n=1 Tax=Halostagnicola kamekurae TaxID=619731 RepID=A0A1I6QQC8_9EURY|nr:hypothetical protein SAMN04488556_1452 [Halostagnicola kamekurae]
MQFDDLNLNPSRVTRLVGSIVAIFIALRLTDDFFTGLGVAVVLVIVLDIPWSLHNRYVARDK